MIDDGEVEHGDRSGGYAKSAQIIIATVIHCRRRAVVVVVVSRYPHVARANAEIGQRQRGFLARKVADKIIIAKVFFWNGSTTTVYYVFVFHRLLLLFIIVTLIVFSTLK